MLSYWREAHTACEVWLHPRRTQKLCPWVSFSVTSVSLSHLYSSSQTEKLATSSSMYFWRTLLLADRVDHSTQCNIVNYKWQLPFQLQMISWQTILEAPSMKTPDFRTCSRRFGELHRYVTPDDFQYDSSLKLYSMISSITADKILYTADVQ